MPAGSFITRLDKKDIVYSLVVLAISLIVFFPSFFHITRADHTIYLTETSDIHNLPDQIRHSYSYARQRKTNQGDVILFRPLLFVLMSVEKQLFGYDFRWWQITGFALHLVVALQLLRIMRFAGGSSCAYFFILLFSVLTISQEMVIWHHISGYILSLIFLL